MLTHLVKQHGLHWPISPENLTSCARATRVAEGRRLPDGTADGFTDQESPLRKSLPDKMFTDAEQSRLSALRSWVLDQEVTEIEMSERQFWNFAQLQPVAEKPWVTFMGRQVYVPNMPEGVQRQLGIFDTRSPGTI
jgi:hypothetical protein